MSDTVEVLTVYCVNPDKNEDKMYRTFASDTWVVIQYGPNGSHGYRNLSWRPESGAQQVAADLIRKKELKGYADRQMYTFTYTPPVDTSRPTLEALVNRHVELQTQGLAPGEGPPSAEPLMPLPAVPLADEGDRFAEFTARALAAISLSVTDRQRAAVELSLLNARWEELEAIHGKAKSYMNTLHQMMSSP